MTYDEAETVRQVAAFAAAIWEADDLIEVRALRRKANGRNESRQFWVRAADLTARVSELRALNAEGFNIYAGIGPRRAAGGSEAKDVVRLRCLFADLDHCTLADAVARLEGTELPAPTLTVESGHGVHFYWRLREALPPERFAGARGDFDAIASLLKGDPKIKDAPRIMRLPGFDNVKNPAEPIACSLRSVEANARYDLRDFATAVRTGRDSKKASQHAKTAIPPTGDRQDALSSRTRLFLRNGAPEGERNDALFKAACDMKGCGWSRADAEPELLRAAAVSELDDAEARHTIASAYGKPRVATVSPEISSDLPSIQTNNRQLRELMKETWDAVLRPRGPVPEIFARGGTLVRIRRGASGPMIEMESETSLLAMLGRAANWIKVSKEGDTSSVMPHEKAAPVMLVEPDPRVARLDDLVFTPVFAANAEIIARPGYYPDHRVYFCKEGGLIVDLPTTTPTAEAAAAARDFLFIELFRDFPFVDEADIAHAFAALIQLFVRQLIGGCTPLYGFEAPTPGTGKGVVCNVISVVATGAACDARTMPSNEDEVRKHLTSELTLGRPVILLDNQDPNAPVDSPALASVLTTEAWTDRMLGHTKMITLPNNALWLLTGNNPRFSMEMARRTIRVRLDAKTDRPWARNNFRHPRLLEWARDRRADLVRAVLTLVQRWIVLGKPRGTRVLGTFESWSETMGGILAANGISGFLGNLEQFYENADAEGGAWRHFVAAWSATHGEEPQRVATLHQLCADRDLMTDVLGNGNDRSQQSRLGRALVKARDRMFDRFRIAIVEDGDGRRSYRLVAETSADDPPTSSTGSMGAEADAARDVATVGGTSPHFSQPVPGKRGSDGDVDQQGGASSEEEQGIMPHGAFSAVRAGEVGEVCPVDTSHCRDGTSGAILPIAEVGGRVPRRPRHDVETCAADIRAAIDAARSGGRP